MQHFIRDTYMKMKMKMHMNTRATHSI